MKIGARLTNLVFLLAAAAVMAGCSASLGSRPPEQVADAYRLNRDLSELIRAGGDLKAQGRYEEAGQTLEEAARVATASDSALALRAWTEAAVSWLAAGQSDRFVAAVDALWRGADDWDRRAMDSDVLVLVALADRLGGGEPRVPARVLPPEIRSLLEAPPVPDFRLTPSGRNP